MADTRMNPEAPPTPEHAPVFRKDYEPPRFLIPEVELDFDLRAAKTRVKSALTVTRNGDHDEPLRLAGDELRPLSVKVDGEDARWTLDGDDLVIPIEGDRAIVETEVEIAPDANSQLMGLYASGGLLCTQCESEGFRRITFHPDRPDVLSRYKVTMHADKARYPVLLANGNEVETGDEDDGRHYAVWEDPFPKPSYLFALVAGDLKPNRDHFTTMSGRKVDLAIWVREKDLPRTAHAMKALKDSMKWDEEVYGREYDLDLFNIVAVDDFNFGAMENKGLNIFNSRYILADQETATDNDFDNIAGVVAHEYFHNWSGNRVTCRDWFQLSLKEGFTVFRDQCFSQDMGSESVKRIEDVRLLRAVQFPEDNGPLAHPVRPESYIEISNFYTATVYNKGAELIRMMRTILREEKFRAGSDLYFERHDGEAATCEDFVKAMEDASGTDLSQFRRWYEQAGTPIVKANLAQADGIATLKLSQSIPDTPGQSDKQPMAIPLKVALLSEQSGNRIGEERLVMLTEAEQTETFDGVDEPVLLSINRGFSAPVRLQTDREDRELQLLAASDDDPFARYEASQELMMRALTAAVGGDPLRTEAVVEAVRKTLENEALDPAFKAEAIVVPSESMIGEQLEEIDPDKVHEARIAMRKSIADAMPELFTDLLDLEASGDDLSPDAKGRRKLRNVALAMTATHDPKTGAAKAKSHYDKADNMTDRVAALGVLSHLDAPEREAAFDHFYDRYRNDTLVLDKWFSLQAMSQREGALEAVEALSCHPDFNLKNPNRLRALMLGFASNQFVFHHASGRGYKLLADMIIAADKLNPQVAARMVPPLGRWRRFEPKRRELMKGALERIAAADGLSKDVFEQVSKSLG
ncbi:aminopeptidase N [Sphingomicrobium clamense]|uniref:Aminopeptidase N n=1 Tax=Sphingomicrobium clamense TaxID=2851013 RepID=A0ABS6V3T3_9SPHN|nr:aminopeptidase N [Sphingomicrobium sp. B8]MBW0144222.1 aminopeptidase N [Sphingomicrobium sp. B8]